MADKSHIEWTDATWNPVRGCSRVSEGCRNRYAERVAARFSGPGQAYKGLAKMTQSGPRWTGKVRLIEEQLAWPRRWTRPRRIFVNSMSDLFHEGLSIGDVRRVLDHCIRTPRHIYQVLTKRAYRMSEIVTDWLNDRRIWPPPSCLWLGVSVEDQPTLDERIPWLLKTPAAVRWVSYEPALGPVDFTEIELPEEYALSRTVRAHINCLTSMDDAHCLNHHAQVDWIVVGGESGPGARPFDVQWARDTISQCRAAGTPVFVKQLGAYVLDRNDAGFEGDPGEWPMDTATDESDNYQGAPCRVRLHNKKGGAIEEWPEHLRVREYPA